MHLLDFSKLLLEVLFLSFLSIVEDFVESVHLDDALEVFITPELADVHRSVLFLLGHRSVVALGCIYHGFYGLSIGVFIEVVVGLSEIDGISSANDISD